MVTMMYVRPYVYRSSEEKDDGGEELEEEDPCHVLRTLPTHTFSSPIFLALTPLPTHDICSTATREPSERGQRHPPSTCE